MVILGISAIAIADAAADAAAIAIAAAARCRRCCRAPHLACTRLGVALARPSVSADDLGCYGYLLR